MAPGQAALDRPCPRCAGRMCRSDHDKDCAEYSCLLCGEHVYFAAPRPFVGKRKRSTAEAGSVADGPGRAR
jgi:hypothetical protein